ncbi:MULTISPECIES: hypothetical protein [unclassified Bradyrhizobium]|uniref:hypothetical protein n=1 Tax=unclassified Bradyrhizobium TaxID=2631580 RepID=UPI00339B550E
MAALIGMPFSIMANLWTEPVRGYLAKQRTIRLNSQKDKELADHALVRALSEGHPLAVLTVQGERNWAVRVLVQGVFCMVISAAFVSFAVSFVNAPAERALLLFTGISAILCGAVGLSAAISSHGAATHADNLVLKATKLKEYEDEIYAKWGADAIMMGASPARP